MCVFARADIFRRATQHKRLNLNCGNLFYVALIETQAQFTMSSLYLLVFIAEQNLVEISSVKLVAFCRRLRIHTTRYMAIRWKHDVIHKTGNTQRIVTSLQKDGFNTTCTKIWWSSAMCFSSSSGIRTDKLVKILHTPPVHISISYPISVLLPALLLELMKLQIKYCVQCFTCSR